MKLTLAEIAEATEGVLDRPEWGSVTVDGVSIDSRTIQAGNLFVPIIAERDGHEFVAGALAAGAVAYLAASDVVLDEAQSRDQSTVPVVRVADTELALAAIGRLARSKLSGPVIGITGSVGKTSVKDLTRAACSGAGRAPVWAARNSFNNELGVPLTLANAPDGVGTVVVEMGARGIGHISYLCDIARPTVGVVTTVALAHSELFGSIEGVAQGKGELIEAIPTDGVAVLNADNPHVLGMASRAAAPVLTFGSAVTSPDADFVVDNIELDRSLHPTFDLTHGGKTAQVSVPVAGAHMALNAAAAVAVAVASGVDFADATMQVSSVEMSPWRMEVTTSESGVVVINDAYNANPTSMRAALAALAKTGAENLVAVVGEMAELGDEGPEEHLAITAEAKAAGIRVVAVAAEGYGAEAEHVADIPGALDALGSLPPSSAVLVKGSRVVELERLAQELGAGTQK